jgi:hypothetical protein
MRSALLFISAIVILVAAALFLRQPDHSLRQTTVSFPAIPIFRGRINIAADDWHRKPVTIMMNLDTGLAGTSEGSRLSGGQSAHCRISDTNPQQALASLDKTSSIPCEQIDALIVANLAKEVDGKKITSRLAKPYPQMWDAVWSPDSTSIAILVGESSSEWLSQQGFLSLITSLGPLHLTTYRLFLYSTKSGVFEELPIPLKDLQGAWATIEWSPS